VVPALRKQYDCSSFHHLSVFVANISDEQNSKQQTGVAKPLQLLFKKKTELLSVLDRLQ
jgi:hypothetical protein